jgi:hypothetical protein
MEQQRRFLIAPRLPFAIRHSKFRIQNSKLKSAPCSLPFSELLGFLRIETGAADWRVGGPLFLAGTFLPSLHSRHASWRFAAMDAVLQTAAAFQKVRRMDGEW